MWRSLVIYLENAKQHLIFHLLVFVFHSLSEKKYQEKDFPLSRKLTRTHKHPHIQALTHAPYPHTSLTRAPAGTWVN
jgi:hypothetical protein